MLNSQFRLELTTNKINELLPNHIQPKFKIRTLFLAILLIALNFNNASAQYHNDAICISGGKLEMDYRKKPWKGNNQFLLKYLKHINYFKDEDKVRYLVPVKFWVHRNNDGEGGSSYADIKEFITDLNYYNKLNQTGIQFYIREIDYINKSKKQVFGYYLEAPLQTLFKHAKQAINVYLIDRFKKKKGAKKTIKGTYNIFTKSVILQRKNSSTGLTHEIGHYFGLLHPHRHYNKGKSSQEPVSRTRTAKEDGKGLALCELHGDLLADTPAEPKLTFLVDNDCQFTGSSLTDAWGDNYHSDASNIMSYPTHYSCRDSFTIGQKAIMLYSASANKYAKYWNTEDEANHKYLYDANEPDDFFEMSGAMETGVSQRFNFHKIFMTKKEDRTDTCDWHKFEVKMDDKRNVRIIITPAKENHQPVSAVFYDKNLISLSAKTTQSNEAIELAFNNVVSDWYYIKITSKENNQTNEVDQYTVEVKLE